MATGMLCVLDASINISMEPFRALVADKLGDEQRTQGFAMQSILIGLGAMFASYLPNIFHSLGISNTAAQGVIPDSVRYAFYFGAFCFIAAIMYTNMTTPEDPPQDMEAFLREKEDSKGILNVFTSIFNCILKMPTAMKQIALVQLFTWFALFAMWSNATPAITSHVFHTTDTTSSAYNDGADYINWCWVLFNLSNVITGFLIYFFGKGISKKMIHFTCLVIGGLGLMSIYFVTSPSVLQGSFILIGVAWASILSMPFAIISSAIPAKDTGVYMGLFNMFICIPQIIASLGGLNFLTHHLIGPNAIHGILLAGILMVLAAFSTILVKEEATAA
jgi:maltose/moltooligosaccharide transporter